MNQIERILTRLFETHRIIIWYDDTGEMRGEFALLDIAGVEKIEIANNEFGIKRRILKVEPEQNFLLYQGEPQPPDAENWLLDVALAHKLFRADPVAMLLNELGLGQEFAEIIMAHREFFKPESRKKALASLLRPNDSAWHVRMKMCAVCAGIAAEAAHDLPDILFAFLKEAAEEGDANYRRLVNSHLDGWLWDRVGEAWGYRAGTPAPWHFAQWLFATGSRELVEPVDGAHAVALPAAIALLHRWKDSSNHRAAFMALSDQIAESLAIATHAQRQPLESLAANEFFAAIDVEIAARMVEGVSGRTLRAPTVAALVARRRTTPWFAQGEWQAKYEAVTAASTLLDLVETTQPHIPNIAAGLEGYVSRWYRIDQAYRHFIANANVIDSSLFLGALADKVEDAYQNAFLIRLASAWQQCLDAVESWPPAGVTNRFDFFARHVRPWLDADQKALVIISDALRFEVAEELGRRMQGEDRYTIALDGEFSPLPSYTQLGMAALLPHDAPFRIALDKPGATVYLGAKSTVGLDNRRAMLETATGGKATALAAADFLAMDRPASRAFFNSHNVVYLYHNVIDATGDKQVSEGRVFAAVEEAIEEIVRIIKKGANANYTNFVVTADHGFLYQNRPIDGADFAVTAVEGGTHEDRRFVLGKEIRPSERHKNFCAAQLGLEGDFVAAFPKGLLRLRKSGSGSRYVHGGTTLQEVVVPVLKINKARSSDLSQVEVEANTGALSVISTPHVLVQLFQRQPVTDKMKKRILRAGLYSASGMPLSNELLLEFASPVQEHLQRERSVQLTLNREADTFNNQVVYLKLTNIAEPTGAESEYLRRSYTLRRTFTSDF